MPDLKDGESVEVKGSAAKPYILKNVGGVYSCSCASWRNQSTGVIRTCKHLKNLRGDEAEAERVGGSLSKPVKSTEKKATAPPVLLANNWTSDVDPTGWLMSEKLDGVRAWWDGSNFISRLGNIYHAPKWFKEGLPPYPLDGELWLARKMFQRCVSIVRRQDQSDDWKDIQYVVFDAPSLTGLPFSSRLKFLQDLLIDKLAGLVSSKKKLKYADYLEQVECEGVKHLKKELAKVEKRGGEGLMLRQPDSLYEAGRSSTLLKVKSFFDAEAEVIAHEPGNGKHKGRLGALRVQLDDGTEFSVGTGFSDDERGSPPPIGSTITFRYQELSTTGVPRFPSFVRVFSEEE